MERCAYCHQEPQFWALIDSGWIDDRMPLCGYCAELHCARTRDYWTRADLPARCYWPILDNEPAAVLRRAAGIIREAGHDPRGEPLWMVHPRTRRVWADRPVSLVNALRAARGFAVLSDPDGEWPDEQALCRHASVTNDLGLEEWAEHQSTGLLVWALEQAAASLP